MKYYNIFYVLILIGLISCESPENWDAETDSVAPGVVTNVVSTGIPGGAMITYDIPDDSDLLGVKAVYEGKDGTQKEVFSSSYKDTITLAGFGDTLSHAANLFAVDKSMNESEPIAFNFTPKEPPVITIEKSLECMAAFGGLYVSWDNETESDIGIELWMKDSLDEPTYVETYYSDAADGEYSFRGLDSEETEFTLKVKDRWGNYSDSKIATITPYYEEWLVGKGVFEAWGLSDYSCTYRGDIPSYKSGAVGFALLWDEVTLNRNTNTYLHTGDAGNLLSYYSYDYTGMDDVANPEYFTIDMQESHTLSRMKMWMRGRNSSEDYLDSDGRYYQQGALKYYEVWGCDNPKTVYDFIDRPTSVAYWTSWSEVGGTDAWKDNWVKLGETAALPPSGATVSGNLTVDDIIYADEGFDTLFYPWTTEEKYRYVRIVVNETWGGKGTKLFINELRFWGE